MYWTQRFTEFITKIHKINDVSTLGTSFFYFVNLCVQKIIKETNELYFSAISWSENMTLPTPPANLKIVILIASFGILNCRESCEIKVEP